MNNKLFASALIAAAAFAAAPSFADNISGEVGYVPPAPVASKSGVTRDAVRNDYLQAQRNDALPATGEGADIGYAAVDGNGNRSRQDVRNEYLQAARSHRLAPRGEGADIGYVASDSVLTREAVRADAMRALRQGRIADGEV